MPDPVVRTKNEIPNSARAKRAVSPQKNFDELFELSHRYLERGRELRRLWVTDKVSRTVKDYKRILLRELHLIAPLLKARPELKQSFYYERGSKSFRLAYKMYQRILNNPPKGIHRDQSRIFKVLWESVHIITILDEVTRDSRSVSILDHALVAMCTAYECYVKDCFCWSLNNIPLYAQRYVSTLSTPVKEMARYEYDPLGKAGDIFLDREGQAFKIFDNGKKLFREALEFEIFENTKKEELLWKIFQTRHCIIHNGGNPDTMWHLKTKNVKFRKDPKTLNRYIDALHDEFHFFYARLYRHIFKKAARRIQFEKENTNQSPASNPPPVIETRD